MEIQSGAVTKSYMRKGFLIYSMRKCANISPYMRRPLVIYDFATAPFRISLYIRQIWFSFLSVYGSTSFVGSLVFMSFGKLRFCFHLVPVKFVGGTTAVLWLRIWTFSKINISSGKGVANGHPNPCAWNIKPRSCSEPMNEGWLASIFLSWTALSL